jgi:class 3 adenylate cyclase/predicted ATPase
MTCGSCGTKNPADSRFCNSCGHPLVTRSDERRVATVVFADLVGFTSLSESRDPEQVKNLVDRCFERLAQDITDFGGQVDKIMGDAIIALFGAPVAHEDDAERAVRAALRMQETLLTFQAGAEIRVQLRVGVNTGEVLVGSLRAGGEYTAMGDVVNTAQRLQAGAEPGAVVVGPATYAATRDCIDYRSLGQLQAKGREEPVDAWLAVAPLLPPGYRRRRQETPFVGRDPEIGVLSHAIDAAVERNRAHLALLIGEAGVGKSRLAEEAACLAKNKHRAAVFEGRCVPYGEANIWWPVAEALRQACGISADDPLPHADELAIEAVSAALEQPTRSPEVKRIVNGLLFLMGYEVSLRDIDPLRAREEASRSVLAFVEASARHRPVVIVVSDLHWADDLVLETMDALLDRLRGSPFVLLATARQELYDRWSLPAGRHNSIIVNLDPLDRESTGSLLSALTEHEVSDDMREALLDRAGGNPFFLEELVALLADGDHVPLELTSSHDSGSLSQLPDTLRGLVSARLDSLTPNERATLEDAAVWGRSGPVAAIERMAEQIHGITSSAELLGALADKEILTLQGDRWAFHSDLIREVAYGTLTKADRARRHCGIAYYLETTQPERREASDRTVDVIAYHYGAAAELLDEVGAVTGVPADVVELALEWISEAARRAEIAQALPVSVRLYSQALRLTGDTRPERRVLALLGRASARTEMRQLDAASVDIDEARELAAAMEDPVLTARGTLALGEFEQKSGSIDESLATVQKAIDQFREVGNLKGVADGLRVLGMSHIFNGHYDLADASISAALAASRELGDRRGEAWALQNLAWTSYIEGRADEAEARLNESATTFQELGDSGGLNWALGLMAFVRFHQGKLAEAEELGEQILIEAHDRGDRWGEGMMLLLMSGVKLWSGRSSDAAEAAGRALAVFEAIGDRFGSAQARANVGRALVTSGRVDEGLKIMREAVDRHPALGDLSDPDQLELLEGVSLAGAAVQIGDSGLALMALGGEHGPDFEPETIGHGDALVAESLALLQAGRIEAAVERLLPYIESDPLSPSPYGQSVLALALATAGHDQDVIDLVVQVDAAPRATYLDKFNARLAELLVLARRGDRDDALKAYEALCAHTDAVDDPVAQAIVRLGAAVAFAAQGWVAADAARIAADRRLEVLDIRAEGWRTVFKTAAKAKLPAPATKT